MEKEREGKMKEVKEESLFSLLEYCNILENKNCIFYYSVSHIVPHPHTL